MFGLCYILRAIRAGRYRERPHIYLDIFQNAPFRSQIFKIFFASGGKGALTPLRGVAKGGVLEVLGPPIQSQ